MFSPPPYSTYTNDQPIQDGPMSFIYADGLCITAQYHTFQEVEKNRRATGGTDTLLQKQPSACDSDKRQVTAFHLRKREAKRSLHVSWNGVDLENTDTPKYLGVTLDRTLSNKTHIHNTKMKVVTRNNLLNKLANSRWGTNARTIRTKNHSLMLLYC